MRQYRILYCRPDTDWTQLEPHIHSRVYDRPEINASIEHMRANFHVEGMAVRLETELFNIVASNKEELQAGSFPMEATDEKT